MAEFNPMVDPPRGLSYAAPLIDFSAIGNLPTDAFNAAEKKRQYDLARAFQGGIPTDPQGNPDYRAITNILAQKGDIRAIGDLAPYALAQQPGQVSPLFGGPAQGQPAGPGMGPPPQAAAPAAPAPSASVPPGVPVARGGYTTGGTIVDLVADKLPQEDPKTGMVIANIARAVGVDPNVALPPDKLARAQRLVDSYIARTAGGTAPATPAPAPQAATGRVADAFAALDTPAVPLPRPRPPEAPSDAVAMSPAPVPPRDLTEPSPGAAPGAPAAAAAPGQPLVPQVQLPPGFTDPQKAIAAMRAEEARLSMSRIPAERAQVPMIAQWRQQIENSLQPIQIGGALVDPRTRQVIYERPVSVGGALVMPSTGQPIYQGGATLSGNALEGAAQRYFQTGQFPSGMTRDTASNRADRGNIQQRAYEIADEQGLQPADLPARWQSFQTHAAGLRVLEQRAAGMTLIENEAKRLVPRIREQLKTVSRSNYPDLNRIWLAGKEKTGDPNVVRLGISMESLVPVYARVLKPVGQIGVTDTENARHILNKLWSEGQITGALDQIELEIESAHNALTDARKQFSGAPGAETPKAPPPAAATGGSDEPKWQTLPNGVRVREMK